MIARTWRGWVRTEQAAAYVEYITRTGLSEYEKTPGNLGAQMWTADLGDGRTEVMTVSWWSSRTDIEGFAGQDIDVAVFYPEDDDLPHRPRDHRHALRGGTDTMTPARTFRRARRIRPRLTAGRGRLVGVNSARARLICTPPLVRRRAAGATPEWVIWVVVRGRAGHWGSGY